MSEPLSPVKSDSHQNTTATDDSPPEDLDWNDPTTRMALGLEFVERYLKPSEVVALRVVCKAFDQALCSADFYWADFYWIDRIRQPDLPFDSFPEQYNKNAYLSLLRGFGHGNRLPIRCYYRPADNFIKIWKLIPTCQSILPATSMHYWNKIL